MDYSKLVCDFIDSHKKEYLNDLSLLIAEKSVLSEAKEGMPFGEGTARAMKVLCSLFEKYGFSYENMENFISYADLNDKCNTAVDILSHIDVVDEGDGWGTDPYVMTEKLDGCIYGRGVGDDKGPTLAALYAMRAIKECGVPLSKNARLIVGGNEETGSELDLDKYYGKFSHAPATFSPDADFPITNTEKGLYRCEFKKSFESSDNFPRLTEFSGGYKINVIPSIASAKIVGLPKEKIEFIVLPLASKMGVKCNIENSGDGVSISVEGMSAHASMPETGNNGITALIKLLCTLPLAEGGTTDILYDLENLLPHGDYYGRNLGINLEDEISGKLTIALTLLEISENSVCGSFDGRVPICANEKNCKSVCDNLFSALGYKIYGEMKKAHHTPPDSDFIKTLSAVYEEYTGRKSECQSMGGNTYVHSIDGGVAFGACMPDFDMHPHSANERASISDLLLATKIYAESIIRLCK